MTGEVLSKAIYVVVSTEKLAGQDVGYHPTPNVRLRSQAIRYLANSLYELKILRDGFSMFGHTSAPMHVPRTSSTSSLRHLVVLLPE